MATDSFGESFDNFDSSLLEEEFSYEETELTGLQAFSHLYGFSVREEQFQDFYNSFSNLRNRLKFGGYRDGSRHVQRALQQFVDASNTYLGIEMTVDEFSDNYTEVSMANFGAIPRHADQILEGIGSENGHITEDKMREIITDVKF